MNTAVVPQDLLLYSSSEGNSSYGESSYLRSMVLQSFRSFVQVANDIAHTFFQGK